MLQKNKLWQTENLYQKYSKHLFIARGIEQWIVLGFLTDLMLPGCSHTSPSFPIPICCFSASNFPPWTCFISLLLIEPLVLTKYIFPWIFFWIGWSFGFFFLLHAVPQIDCDHLVLNIGWVSLVHSLILNFSHLCRYKKTKQKSIQPFDRKGKTNSGVPQLSHMLYLC